MSTERPTPAQQIETLTRRAAGRDVFIWGAKITGISSAACLARTGAAALGGFVDHDPARAHAAMKGHTVLLPDEFFAGNTPRNAYVLVAGRQYEDEIAAELAAHGFAEADYSSAYDLLGPIYELDVIRVCNLRCPSCPQGNYDHPAFKEKMTTERFEKILAKILKETPNVAHIGLYSWGEPFLHPQLPEFVRMCKNVGIPCFLSSNLSHEFSLDETVKADPDYFRVSISGFSQPVYEIDHAGGNINLVKSNMYRLRYLLDKYKATTQVEVVYHKYNYNLHELPRVEAMCEDLGFTLASYVASVLPNENVIALCEGKKREELQPLIDRLLFDIDKLPREDLRGREDECFAFFHSIGLTPTGQVIVCHNAFDTDKSLLAQDFLDTTFEELIKAKYSNETCVKCRKYGVTRMYGAIIDDAGRYTWMHKDEEE